MDRSTEKYTDKTLTTDTEKQGDTINQEITKLLSLAARRG